MAKQISDLNWEKRIVIISFEKKEDQIFLFTQKFVSENKCSIEKSIVRLGMNSAQNIVIPKIPYNVGFGLLIII